MMNYNSEENNLKLIDNICCPKCKSKKMEVSEIVSSSNIYTTDESGAVIDVDVNSYSTITPIGMRFYCLICKHSFKKRNIHLLSNAFVDKN